MMGGHFLCFIYVLFLFGLPSYYISFNSISVMNIPNGSKAFILLYSYLSSCISIFQMIFENMLHYWSYLILSYINMIQISTMKCWHSHNRYRQTRRSLLLNRVGKFDIIYGSVSVKYDSQRLDTSLGGKIAAKDVFFPVCIQPNTWSHMTNGTRQTHRPYTKRTRRGSGTNNSINAEIATRGILDRRSNKRRKTAKNQCLIHYVTHQGKRKVCWELKGWDPKIGRDPPLPVF